MISNSFNILAVMSSIILGLAMAELFKRITAIISNLATIKIHWIPFGYCAVIFMFLLSRWWILYRWEFLEAELSYYHFLFLLSFPLILLAISSLVLPTVQEGHFSNLLNHFHKIRKWFFGAVFCLILFDYMETILKGSEYFLSLGFTYIILGIVSIASCIIGAATKRTWVHFLLIAFYLCSTFVQK